MTFKIFFLYHYFSEKLRLISSARQAIVIKYQVLISLKNKILNVFPYNLMLKVQKFTNAALNDTIFMQCTVI